MGQKPKKAGFRSFSVPGRTLDNAEETILALSAENTLPVPPTLGWLLDVLKSLNEE